MGPSPNRCSRCRQPFPGEGVHGLCPRCLGNVAFALDDGVATVEPDGVSQSVPAPTAHSSRLFGDYELLEEIARGGMGVVFKARQISLDRVVAVKLLLSGQFAAPDAIARFRAEALTTARLRHPNIVPVYEVGEANGQPFLAMEWVDGRNLAETVREFPLPPRQAAELVQLIAQAVHFAHQAGILHRDLKPSNVLLDPFGQPRVTDFGLAKRFDHNGRTDGIQTDGNDPSSTQDPLNSLTLTGQVLGSPSFIAPEQASGKRDDLGPACDIYSLGALLYHLLTGRAPFQGATITETLRDVMERDPVSPRLLISGIPRDLETICLKCLAKEPRQRYATAQDLAEELRRFLAGESIQARPIAPTEKLWRWCKRKPALTASLAALLIVGVAGVAGIVWQWRRAEQSAREARFAQRETTTNLWDSYLAQARGSRFSGRLGRRFDSLDALAKAAAIHPAPELRDEAIAAMALFDVRAIKRAWAATNWPPWMSSISDATLERYAIGRTNGVVTVHRMVDDAELLRLPAVETNVARVFAFSPSGRFLAVFSPNGTMHAPVRVWDLELRTVAVTDRCFESETGLSLDFSPDNRSVAMVDGKAQVQIHDLAGGGRRFLPTTNRLQAVRYSPDGRCLAVVSRDVGEVSFLDPDSGQILATNRFDHIVSTLTWHPGGKLVATEHTQGRIQVWHWQTGEVMKTLGRHNESTYSRAFHPEGHLLFSAGWDGTRIWNIHSGEQLMRIPGGVVSLRFRPDGTRLFAQRPVSAEFRVFEIALDDPIRRIDPEYYAHPEPGWTAVFSPDGTLFLNPSEDGFLFVHDVQTGRTLAEVEAGDIKGIAFDAGTNLWTSGARGLLRWPLRRSAGSDSWTLGPPEQVGNPGEHGMQGISRDGLTVAAVEENRCHVYDALTRTERCTLPTGSSKWDFLALTPDGTTLATGIWGSFGIDFWETQTGKRLRVLGHLDLPDLGAKMAFSPNGPWMAVSTGQEISVWRTGDWTPAWRMPNDDFGTIPAISPAPRVLAVRCNRTDLKLFALESGRLLARLELLNGEHVGNPAFSSDGTRLALRGTQTRTAFVLDLRKLRARLARMGLDWEGPTYPPEIASRSTNVVRVEIKTK